MENALASLLMISVLLFTVMSVSDSYFSTQDALMVAEQELQARSLERSRTDINFESAQVQMSGALVAAIVQNTGNTKLLSFDRWDLIIEYEDIIGDLEMMWLPYAAGGLGVNEWTNNGIYQDAEILLPEKFEPGILNPGEEVSLQILLASPVGLGTVNRLTLSVENGISASQVFTR